jgi:hypothetical protein
MLPERRCRSHVAAAGCDPAWKKAARRRPLELRPSACTPAIFRLKSVLFGVAQAVNAGRRHGN